MPYRQITGNYRIWVDGAAWRSRVEHYLTNPAAEPDAAKWEVDIAYLAAGT